MLTMTMMRPTPKIPTFAALLTGAFAFLAIVWVKVAAQTPPATDPSVFAVSKDVFSWVIGFAGAAGLLVGIVYGFHKKYKYENLERSLDEWKETADAREERIKELKYAGTEEAARYKVILTEKDLVILNLRESNGALVSQSLQMKAILKDLRLSGVWTGHEERIHETHERR